MRTRWSKYPLPPYTEEEKKEFHDSLEFYLNQGLAIAVLACRTGSHGVTGFFGGKRKTLEGLVKRADRKIFEGKL